MQETISVIIPTIETEGILLKSVKSVLNQEKSVDKLIIVFDKKNDETIFDYELKLKHLESTVNELSFNLKSCCEIQYVSTKSNLGPGAARNLGLKHAAGYKFIAFLDADDEWEDCHITGFFEFYKKRLNSGCSKILYFDMYNHSVMRQSRLNHRNILFSPRIHTPCAILTNSERVKFPNAHFCEDLALWIDLIDDGYQGYCVNEKGAKGRENRFESGLSSNQVKMCLYKIKFLLYKRAVKHPFITILAIIYELLKLPTRYFRKI
ncbi:glycosyltransferase family 2 protein [Vibrio sp. Vb339]|uniref:glycosyltransferase family 2 protein n=1 Tax=Vibrio sp. Vb339 TaxID=1192013 RepID=UPI001553C67D|nr:glycosyltransferase family 2 protein [Vibrio sp. Vb339]